MADPEQGQFSREVEMQPEAEQEELVAEEADKEAGGVAEEQALAEQTELEEIQANELALQRDREQEAQATNALHEEGQSFSGPSLFKYFIILIMFAIPNDLIDALDFTGIGIMLSWFTSFYLSAITVIIMWFADSELKRVKGHMAKRGEHQKALAKTMTKVASKLTKFAPKNPVIKVIAGAVLEMIPFVSILPWSSISVFLAYSDERKIFKEAGEASEDFGQISSTQAAEVV